MNVSIINKSIVKSEVLDILAKELPAIISGLLEVPGGQLAILKPDQVSLDFSQASVRDVGSDIRINIFARKNDPRALAGKKLTKAILEKTVASVAETGKEHSVSIRLYLMDINVAEYSPSN